MNWFAPVDLYCERTAIGVWNEPLNATSNLSFVLAALLIWRIAQQRGPIPGWLGLMLCLGGGIGVGSFLFHTAANEWAQLADVTPIWSFVACHVYCMVQIMSDRAPQLKHLLVLCVGMLILMSWLAISNADPTPNALITNPTPDPFNGSLSYLPAIAALLLFSLATTIRRHPLKLWISGATVLFTISLFFRTIDLRVCEAWPAGTHFLWHLLNAALIGILLLILSRQVPASPD